MAETDYYFDPEEPKHAEQWMKSYCRHTVGGGGKAELAPFQREFLREALGWKLKDTGSYKYSTIYHFLPRGNGKSTFAQWVGLYKAFGSGINAARSYCFASSKDQANGALFQPVKEMILTHPILKSELQTFHNYVKDPTTGSIYKLMAAKWQNAHSLIASDVDIDELHLQPDGKLVGGVRSGMAKRIDCTPQLRIHTTAGEINTYAHTEHKYYLKVHKGEIKNEAVLTLMHYADEDDDPFDPATWAKANPGWAFKNHREFKELANRAESDPALLNEFKRYNLNMWTGATEAWIPDHEWKQGDSGVSFSDVRGSDCYGGLYVSQSRSINAFCLYFPDYQQLFWWFWCPQQESNFRKITMPDWQKWLDDRYIIEVEGSIVSDSAVVDRILELSNHVNIKQIGYHRQEATSKIQKLEDAGLAMEPYSVTTVTDMNVPVKEIETRIIIDQLHHKGNPVAAYQVDCTKISIKNDMKRPNAEESRDNISGVFAMCIAMGLYMDDREEISPTFETGIETFEI